MLTTEQKQHLFANGYVVIPNAVEKTFVNDALRIINQNFGKGITHEDAKLAEKGSWFPSLVTSSSITNLFNCSSAYTAVCSLLGKKIKPVYSGQIALRFPGTLCADKKGVTPVPWWQKAWHIDGFHAEHNGIPRNTINNFTCLVGVMLSDTSEEFCGNLTVFPKSHHVIEQYFQEKGYESIKQQGLESFAHLPLAKPVQIRAKAGDVVIAHYLLAHTIAPNCSPNIRYAIYFRVNAREDNKQYDLEPLVKMWTDWQGMKEVVAKESVNKKKLIQEATRGELVRPIYADQLYKSTTRSIGEGTQAIEEKMKKANTLFDAHQFKEAKPLFKELTEVLDDDWSLLIKAGCCFTVGFEKPQDLFDGEAIIKKCIALAPLFPNSYTLLAQNYYHQKRYSEVIPLVKKMLECPVHEEKSSTVIDGLSCAKDALAQLNRMDLFKPLAEQAKQSYPALSGLIDSTTIQSKVAELWVKGQQWIQAPKKDFNEGFKLFSQIVALNPKDYWATLLKGGCKTWGGAPKDGEQFIKDAIQLDRKIPNGFSLLAQNLLLQRRPRDSLSVVMEMVNEDFPTISDPVQFNTDHAAKIVEALNCAKTVLGQGETYLQLVKRVKNKYPQMTTI